MNFEDITKRLQSDQANRRTGKKSKGGREEVNEIGK